MQPNFDIVPIKLTDEECKEILDSQLHENIAYGIRNNVILNRIQVDGVQSQRWEAEARIGIGWQGEARGLLLTMVAPVKTMDNIDAIRSRWERVVTEFVTFDLTPALRKHGSITLFDSEEFNDE